MSANFTTSAFQATGTVQVFEANGCEATIWQPPRDVRYTLGLPLRGYAVSVGFPNQPALSWTRAGYFDLEVALQEIRTALHAPWLELNEEAQALNEGWKQLRPWA